MTPSDYYLFENLKSYLCGIRNTDSEQLMLTVEAWLEGHTEEFYFWLSVCLSVTLMYVS